MSENKPMMIIPKECPFCNQPIGLTKKRVIKDRKLTNRYKDIAWCYSCGYKVDLINFQKRPIEDALRAENENSHRRSEIVLRAIRSRYSSLRAENAAMSLKIATMMSLGADDPPEQD